MGPVGPISVTGALLMDGGHVDDMPAARREELEQGIYTWMRVKAKYQICWLSPGLEIPSPVLPFSLSAFVFSKSPFLISPYFSYLIYTVRMLAFCIFFIIFALRCCDAQCWCVQQGKLVQCSWNNDYAFKLCGGKKSGFQTCCSIDDTCESDSICSFTHPQRQGSGFYIAGCTDETHSDSKCNKHCSKAHGEDDILLLSLANQVQSRFVFP